MINQDFKSISELILAFPTEMSCRKHLEDLRWNGTIISPFDSNSKVYVCKQNQYRCSNTKKYFNVKTNTLFHNSNLSLQKWFIAIWLVTTNQKNITSVALARTLKITQKSSWFVLKKINAYFEIELEANPLKKGKKSLKKITHLKNIEVIVEKEKLPMLEWLELLKK